MITTPQVKYTIIKLPYWPEMLAELHEDGWHFWELSDKASRGKPVHATGNLLAKLISLAEG